MIKKILLIVLFILNFTTYNIYCAGSITLDRGTLDRTYLNTFYPTQLDSLVLWFDASNIDSMTLDGSNLCSQWNDYSDLGNNLTQSVSGNQPTYTEDQQNGLSTLYFDANLMTVNPTGIDFSNPFYFACVFNTDDINSKKSVIDLNDIVRLLYNYVTGTWQLQRNSSANLAILDDTDYHCIVAYFKTDYTVDLYFDDTLYEIEDAEDLTANPMTTIGLGGRIGGGGAFTGNIGEFIMWQPDTAFDNDDFIKIKDYLMEKWGI